MCWWVELLERQPRFLRDLKKREDLLQFVLVIKCEDRVTGQRDRTRLQLDNGQPVADLTVAWAGPWGRRGGGGEGGIERGGGGREGGGRGQERPREDWEVPG